MRVVQNKNVAWQIIDGQVLVVTIDDSTLHMLNSTGSRIWEFIEIKRSIEEIAKCICDEFEVEFSKALREASEFAEELANKGIVVVEK